MSSGIIVLACFVYRCNMYVKYETLSTLLPQIWSQVNRGLKVPFTEKFKRNQLSWCRHLRRKEKIHVTRRLINMNVEEWRTVKPKNRWNDCVRKDMREIDISDIIIASKEEWKMN
jgi:hypothetical protein